MSQRHTGAQAKPRSRYVGRWRANVGAALGAALMLAACGTGVTGSAGSGIPNVIKIGQLDSFSGPLGSCAAAADGAKIAVDRANETEMFGDGVRVELVRVDDKGTAEGAVTGYRKLLRERVAGIVGPCGTPSAAAVVKQSEANEIPHILAQPSDADLVEHDYVFRGGPPQVRIAGNTIKAIAELGVERVSVVYTNDYPDTVAVWEEAWESELEAQGITVAGVYPIPNGVPNISSIIERIRQDEPDAIGLDTFGSPTLTYAKQLRNSGFEQPLFGQIIMAYGFYNTSEEAKADGGSYYATSFLPTHGSEIVKNFVSEYKAAHDGADPDPAAAQVYDATTRLLKAIEDAGSVNGADVRKALTEQTSLKAAEGPIEYIDNGHEATSEGYVMHVDSNGIQRMDVSE